MTLDTRPGILIRLYEKLKGWIFRAPKPSYEAAHPTLNPIDIEQLTIELRLREEGRRLGNQGVPEQTSTILAGPEMAVLHRVEKQRQEYMKWGAIRLSNVNDDIHSCNLIQRINNSLAAGETFEASVNAAITRRDAQLHRLSQAAYRAQDELEKFKAANGLTRDAKIPKRMSKAVKMMGLITGVLLDGLFNAYYFSQGMDEGLVGGFVYAFSLAGLNVFFAFILGRFGLPYLWHRRVERRLLGAIGLALFLLSIGGMGLTIAHLRDMLHTGAADATVATLQAWKEAPLELRDITSWGLCLFSAVCGLFAGYAGYSFIDPYPGYTAIAEEANDASDSYEAELDDLRDELDEQRSEAVKSVEATLLAAQEALRRLGSAIRTKKESGIKFRHEMHEAERAVAPLLMTFRDENTLARKGIPTPAYFNEVPALQELPLPDFSVDDDLALLAMQETLVADLLQREQAIKSQIQNAFNQRYQLLKPLHAQFHASPTALGETKSHNSSILLEN